MSINRDSSPIPYSPSPISSPISTTSTSSTSTLRSICHFLVYILVSFKNTSIFDIPISVCNSNHRLKALASKLLLNRLNSLIRSSLYSIQYKRRCFIFSVFLYLYLLLDAIFSLYKQDFKYPQPSFNWKKVLARSLSIPKGRCIFWDTFYGYILLYNSSWVFGLV